MKRIITLFVLSLVVILSCQKILFNEEESSRELYFEDFSSVKFSGIYNIILIQDSTNRLIISGKNNINSIDAVIKDGMLIIDDHKQMPFNPNKNTLTLHFKYIEYMSTWDPVNITNKDTIKADRFHYDAVGEIAEVKLTIDCNQLRVYNYTNTLGYFYLYGKTDYCNFINSYGCSIFADSLICRNAEVLNQSVGDVYINANETLKVYLSGPGNIFYYGSPALEIAEEKGPGKLIHLH